MSSQSCPASRARRVESYCSTSSTQNAWARHVERVETWRAEWNLGCGSRLKVDGNRCFCIVIPDVLTDCRSRALNCFGDYVQQEPWLHSVVVSSYTRMRCGFSSCYVLSSLFFPCSIVSCSRTRSILWGHVAMTLTHCFLWLYFADHSVPGCLIFVNSFRGEGVI